MKVTSRFAHMEEGCSLPVGYVIMPKEKIGVMGNTGASDGAHLHTDSVQGHITDTYRQSDMDEKLTPLPKQAMLLIDEGLFGCEAFVTTPYADPDYYKEYGVTHYGHDVIPALHGNRTIYWNRSHHGVVLSKGFDSGYGYFVNIGFEV